MRINQIIEALETFTLAELKHIDTELHKLIERIEAWQQPVEERQAHGKTYRLEYTKCGKASCKCATGQGHGPYWYAYWSEEGRTRSQYIGKTYRELQ